VWPGQSIEKLIRLPSISLVEPKDKARRADRQDEGLGAFAIRQEQRTANIVANGQHTTFQECGEEYHTLDAHSWKNAMQVDKRNNTRALMRRVPRVNRFTYTTASETSPAARHATSRHAPTGRPANDREL
jgi:isochorismate synthase EntC